MRTVLILVLCCTLHAQGEDDFSAIPDAPIPSLRKSSFFGLRDPEAFDVLPVFGDTLVAYSPPTSQSLKALPISYDEASIGLDRRLPLEDNPAERVPYPPDAPKEVLPKEKTSSHTSRLTTPPLTIKPNPPITAEYGPPALPELPPLPVPTFGPPATPAPTYLPPAATPAPTYLPPPSNPAPTYLPPPSKPLPPFIPPLVPELPITPPEIYGPPSNPGPTYLPPPSKPLPPFIPPLAPELPIAPPEIYGVPKRNPYKAFSYSYSFVHPPTIPKPLPPIFYGPPPTPAPTYLPPPSNPAPTYLPPPSKPLPPFIPPLVPELPIIPPEIYGPPLNPAPTYLPPPSKPLPPHIPPLIPELPITPPEIYGLPKLERKPIKSFSYSYQIDYPTPPILKTPLFGPLPTTAVLHAPAVKLSLPEIHVPKPIERLSPSIVHAPVVLKPSPIVLDSSFGTRLKPSAGPSYLPPLIETPPSSGYSYNRPKKPFLLPTKLERPSYKPFSYSFSIVHPPTIPSLPYLPPISPPATPRPTYLPPLVENPPSSGYSYNHPKKPFLLPTKPSYKPFSYSFSIVHPPTIPKPLPPIPPISYGPPLESLPPISPPATPRPTYLPPLTVVPPSTGYSYNRPRTPFVLPKEIELPTENPILMTNLELLKEKPLLLPTRPELPSGTPLIPPTRLENASEKRLPSLPPSTGYSYNRPQKAFDLPTELERGLEKPATDLKRLEHPSEKHIPSRGYSYNKPQTPFLLPKELESLSTKLLPSQGFSFSEEIEYPGEVQGPLEPVFGDRILSKSSSFSTSTQPQTSGLPPQTEIPEPKSLPPPQAPIIPPPTNQPPGTEFPPTEDELEKFDEDTTPKEKKIEEPPVPAPEKKSTKDFPYSFVFPGSPFAPRLPIPQLPRDVLNNPVPILPDYKPEGCLGDNNCEKAIPVSLPEIQGLFNTAPVDSALPVQEQNFLTPFDFPSVPNLRGPISQAELLEIESLKSIAGPFIEKDVTTLSTGGAPYPPARPPTELEPPYPPAGRLPYKEFLLPNELPFKK